MIISTDKCSQFGHPEFTLEICDGSVPEPHVKQFASTLERMVADGSVFQPGQTVQVGWMLAEVHACEDGRLTLWEPDMVDFPIRYVPGLSESLRHLMLQLFYLDSYSIPRDEADIPSIRESAIVCSRFAECNSLLFSRETSTAANDSGWFVGCADEVHDHNDVDNLTRISLYAAFLARPELHGWIAFPPGSLILLDIEPVVFRDGERMSVVQGSFVDAALKKTNE